MCLEKHGVIKALLFDLGDVIVGLDFDRAYRVIEERTGLSRNQILTLIRDANLASPYERGEISSRAFHQRFSDALDLNLCYEEFRSLWGDMFSDEPLLDSSFFEGLKKSYRLVLVSNTNEIHFRFLRTRHALLDLFDDFVLSYEMGVMKPDLRIYSRAIERARCGAQECFFTDDTLLNVRAARRAGIDAVLFQGREQLEKNLETRGIRQARQGVLETGNT